MKPRACSLEIGKKFIPGGAERLSIHLYGTMGFNGKHYAAPVP